MGLLWELEPLPRTRPGVHECDSQLGSWRQKNWKLKVILHGSKFKASLFSEDKLLYRMDLESNVPIDPIMYLSCAHCVEDGLSGSLLTPESSL